MRGRKAPEVMPFTPVLCAVLKSWREQQGFSIREAAQIIGFKGHSVLYHLERNSNNRARVDGGTLATVLQWLLSPSSVDKNGNVTIVPLSRRNR